MKGIFISAFMLLLMSCGSMYVPAQTAKPFVLTMNMKALQKNKSRISNNDPLIMPAYNQLIKDADSKAMKFAPVSVMEKTIVPPSGDKHDYMSLAPYYWPDPAKPNGLPYIRKDGQTNPEVKEYKDKENMPKLCEYVQLLGLAYYFSGEKKYAEHAANLLRFWFLNPSTKMNPNLNYAQAMKGLNDGRGAGLIDTRHFIKVIDAIGLINGSKSWTKADNEGMKKWFADFLNWMQTSKNGLDELNAKNNHGVWYDAQRLSMALFIGNTDLAKTIIINVTGRLDKQLDEKGFFPAEMERTISLHYTSFVMNAFFTIAHMSEKTGFDFWNYTTASGKSLRKAFDVVKPYLQKEKNWEGKQIKDFDYEDGIPLLMDAAVYFNCRNCEQSVQQLAGDKGPRLMIQLLY